MRYGVLSNLFWLTMSNNNQIENYQLKIRMKEWSVLKNFIPENSTFLDIGCGSGHNMYLAKTEKKCTVFGVDPDPGGHGFGRYNKHNEFDEGSIINGQADELPFEDNQFDVVFCSHVLEHIKQKDKSLKEMKRILKDDGIIIIGMPTSTMSWIAFFSNLLFKFHINLLFFLKSLNSKDFWFRFCQIWVNQSHSYPIAKYVFYDFVQYRKSSWRKLIQKYFHITEEPKMYLYCYPDFRLKFFPIHRNKFLSSSAFFIGSKKTI
ncbi:MAG: hypothetical protein RLZ10_1298 [Bacteroidota bacterium]|jgi:ubiquinone/menaquinone biosynthesis C-methylase UbiE